MNVFSQVLGVSASAEARKLLVLDLDETRIFATEGELARPSDHPVRHYFICRHPHLREFLEGVSMSFEVALRTASTSLYADAICEQLFECEPSVTWARDRCTHRRNLESETWEHHKMLSKIKRRGYDLAGVIAVDDTPEKYAKSYGNLVRVSPFWGDPGGDKLPIRASYLDTLLRSSCLAALLALAGCRTHALAEEPADLIASGRTITQLEALSWRISSPRTARELEAVIFDGELVYAGEDWERFRMQLQPGDELREVEHNAGRGAAIFRRDSLLDMYLWIVF